MLPPPTGFPLARERADGDIAERELEIPCQGNDTTGTPISTGWSWTKAI